MVYTKDSGSSNPNPIKISLNETKIIDLKENYQIKSTNQNLNIKDYQDHYVVDMKNNKELEWNYAIITSNQNGKIESVIYRFKASKFDELSNFLQNETSNINISNTPVKNGKHITLDRGEYYVFLWQKPEEEEFDLQYVTKDFFSKPHRTKSL